MRTWLLLGLGGAVARLVATEGETPESLEGRLRVITCDAETCRSEVQPITIALPPRLPAG